MDFCLKLAKEESMILLPEAKMETSTNGISTTKKWGFKGNEVLHKAAEITIRGILNLVSNNLGDDKKPIIFGHGDPSGFPCFRTTSVAEDAIVNSLRSGKHNCYAPTVGVLSARTAIAEYVSKDIPKEVTEDDVYVTIGAFQGIEALITVLTCPGANILLPRPAYPLYESRSTYSHLEIRPFNLLPEKGWEVDLEAVEALADENTTAIVIINPGNPCGNVYSYEHLKKIAETARKLGIMVIADEVYGHLTFGDAPFVPMAVFSSIAPVVTLGALSKRWVVPGWRLGWLITHDDLGVLRQNGIIDGLKSYLNISSDPATFIQAAIPEILEKTTDEFFSSIVQLLKENSIICYNKIKDMPTLTCPQKPQGGMFLMIEINLLLFEDIVDDLDFCLKLAKEDCVVVLPGRTLGSKNWVRINFAVDRPSMEEGLERIQAFCERHSKN